jgi:hypothetical protein
MTGVFDGSGHKVGKILGRFSIGIAKAPKNQSPNFKTQAQFSMDWMLEFGLLDLG